jgi:hypothetical protein
MEEPPDPSYPDDSDRDRPPIGDPPERKREKRL